MVLSVWSVVAVDEVTWTMISGSWRGEEESEGGETGEERAREGKREERGERSEGRGEERIG